MMTRVRVRQLAKEGFSRKAIQRILLSEKGRKYSIDTIRQYMQIRMDLEKDKAYMEHCREEYAPKEEPKENILLEEMYSRAIAEGFIKGGKV
jgi:hypothetical protein